MATDREILETVARCVATMACYRNSGRTPEASELMVIETQLIAGHVARGLHLDQGEVDVEIFKPLRDELIVRYGYEVGNRLLAEFVDVFEQSSLEFDRQRPSKVRVSGEPRLRIPLGSPSAN